MKTIYGKHRKTASYASKIIPQRPTVAQKLISGLLGADDLLL